MKDVITKAVKEALVEFNWPAADFVVEHPAELAHGDYACNVALVLAKQVGESPRVAAEKLAAALEGKITNVTKIEIAGPGFLNFSLERAYFTSVLQQIIKEGDEWGENDSWAGKKVLVEYTDPNPFKEFHIGHLFTNAVGESIARLFVFNGAETKRINYQGDVGLHVACALWGMLQLGLDASSDFSARELGKAYALGATKYKEDEQTQVAIREINKKVYSREDRDMNALYDTGRQVSLDYFETIYKMLGTEFSSYFFESEAGAIGKELVLSHQDVFVESDGAHIFKGEDHGLHTRVFVNKEGLPTYEAKELALAKLKEDRLGQYDLSVICTGNEVNDYFKVLIKAMSFVYPELANKTEHLGHGMVRLKTGKMSSRTGDVISALDFIDEVAASAVEKMAISGKTEPDTGLAQAVAIAAVKYSVLKGSILQHSVFDKEQALSFEGDSGPYLQYTHARIASVLKKAEGLGLSLGTEVVPEITYEVERLIYHFPEVVETALQERAPHKVAVFITELASAFNSFYANEKIADTSDTYAPYKLVLAKAVKQTIKNGLWVLGIKAPEEM